MRRAAAACAAAALLSLAACAADPGSEGAPAAVPAPQPAPDGVTAAPVAPAPGPDASQPAVAALPPPAPPGTPRPPEDVRRLLGTPAGVLRELMGDVVFVRRDGAAEIWRFADESCFLDVFLYRESDGLKVAHVDARSRTDARITPQSCYGRIRDARKPRPAS